MPFRYKIDIISALKAAGYSSYIIQTQNLISQRSMQKMRENKRHSVKSCVSDIRQNQRMTLNWTHSVA